MDESANNPDDPIESQQGHEDGEPRRPGQFLQSIPQPTHGNVRRLEVSSPWGGLSQEYGDLAGRRGHGLGMRSAEVRTLISRPRVKHSGSGASGYVALMGDVPAGLYEHLVTDRLSGDLTAISADLVQLGTLDPADAHETLTRHIAALAGRALRAAAGSDATAINRQVELANRIVAAVTAVAGWTSSVPPVGLRTYPDQTTPP